MPGSAFPTAQPAAPLDGLVVLDFSELLPGPFFTQNLADLGATVIRVERPPHGDNLRRMAPHLYAAVNRGKQSFLVDLREPGQRARVMDWVGRADVLVESYRPGVMAKYGLDPASLRERHPRLVYVSLSGYGHDGPDAALPGHDANYLAAAGVLALAGTPDGPPINGAGVPVADLAGATYATAALMTALYQRERTGRGQHLDVALTDGPLHWMNPRLAALRVEPGGGDTQAKRQRMGRAAYGVFACRDGYITIGALEDHFWRRLAASLDLGEYGGEAYARAPARQARAQAINARLAQACAAWDTDALMAHLTRADVPAMPVRDPATLHEVPHFVARGMYADTEAGPMCRFPVRIDGMPPTPTTAAALRTEGEPEFPAQRPRA
ncbi:CoA transferase [Verticiella sediminum]|uniref:CoA transferase n=1 Tax=Verticiella sediminum TaxID=1247510 RepID=A0A556AWK2_9BURK|nr:CoA transferase [Verticiella sediminum]TSH97314.1 CoA transferase [Verticiella sediminum]